MIVLLINFASNVYSIFLSIEVTFYNEENEQIT